MRLESARELKSELSHRVLERMTSLSAEEVSGYGLPARRTTTVEAVLPTLALGVAPAPRRGYRVAVRIQRRGMVSSPPIDTIHKAARGEVDVRYIGRVVKGARPWYRSRRRPLLIGISIGHFAVTAGTLGCFVQTRKSEVRILSNNHVLADENHGKAGDPILQPGRYDGGTRRGDTVGNLDSFVRLKVRGANLVDCARSTLRSNMEFEPAKLRGVGTLTGVWPSDEDVDEVEKLGRTTGHTQGRITAFELDNVVVAYDMGNLRFDDQLEIEGLGAGPFSDGGDSGSLIFTSGDKLALALLFAGSQQGGSNGAGLTYGNPFGTVLDSLKVRLVT